MCIYRVKKVPLEMWEYLGRLVPQDPLEVMEREDVLVFQEWRLVVISSSHLSLCSHFSFVLYREMWGSLDHLDHQEAVVHPVSQALTEWTEKLVSRDNLGRRERKESKDSLVY